MAERSYENTPETINLSWLCAQIIYILLRRIFISKRFYEYCAWGQKGFTQPLINKFPLLRRWASGGEDVAFVLVRLLPPQGTAGADGRMDGERSLRHSFVAWAPEWDLLALPPRPRLGTEISLDFPPRMTEGLEFTHFYKVTQCREEVVPSGQKK